MLFDDLVLKLLAFDICPCFSRHFQGDHSHRAEKSEDVKFSIYEATSSRQNRSLGKELITGAVASVFLGFGSLFLLLASGVYV
ncbi:hypothetical protein WN943_001207 [Citrus x changshan-huyou]